MSAPFRQSVSNLPQSKVWDAGISALRNFLSEAKKVLTTASGCEILKVSLRDEKG